MSICVVANFVQALQRSNYGAEPMLRSCGVSISTNFTQVEGRVLPAPRVESYLDGLILFFLH